MRGSKPGERRGGRQKGTLNRRTLEQGAALSTLAQRHTAAALKTLVDVATRGESEAARVAAAVAILDRGYGKPVQSIKPEGSGSMVMTWKEPQSE